MQRIHVSVIVPTYNRPEFLERALKSVYAQSFTDYEVILVNDAGKDVQEVVNKFPDMKIKYIQHEKNKGLAATRNTGLKVATGRYITFLDDDDVIYPVHFQRLVKAMEDGAQVAYTDCYWWENDTNLVKVLSKDFDKVEFHNHNLFPVHCVMVRKALFRYNKFDESLNSHEDWDLWLRLSEKVDFVHIPVFTCAYSKRGGQDQISNRDYHTKAYQEVKRRYAQPQPPKSKVTDIKDKVLIFMPTYEIDDVIQAWPESVQSMYDLIIPDNWEAEFVIGLDNPYGLEGKHKNTLHQYQMIRRRVIDEGFDALVTFEHDMIVQKDGLVKLLEVDAPIVYGLYMLRHGAYCVNAFLHIEGSPNPHKSMTYLPRKYMEAEKRGWARVSGVGMGFTLFRRKVLDMFDFRASGESYPPDWAISVDATKYGLKQICRFDVKCGHIEKNGLTIYPTREGLENMTKVKILKQFVSGDLYEKGMIVNIPSEKIDDFFRAGYIEILNEPELPAVKIVKKPNKKFSKAVKDGVHNSSRL